MNTPMTPDEAIRERLTVAAEEIASHATAIHAALERIAVALEQIHAGFAAAPLPCPHPESEREDRGSTMGHPRWRCGLCGYEEGDGP